MFLLSFGLCNDRADRRHARCFPSPDYQTGISGPASTVTFLTQWLEIKTYYGRVPPTDARKEDGVVSTELQQDIKFNFPDSQYGVDNSRKYRALFFKFKIVSKNSVLTIKFPMR